MAERYLPQGRRGEPRRLSKDMCFDLPEELKKLMRR